MRDGIASPRLVILLALLLTTTTTASVRGEEPVPKEMLSGRTLTAKDANCSIDAPEGTEWISAQGTIESGVRFFCRKAGTKHLYSLAARSGRFNRFTPKRREGFQREVAQARARAQNLTVTDAELPRAGESYHYKYDVTRDDGSLVHVYGYATSTPTVTYALECTTTEAEPPGMDTFVRSFKFLEAPAPWPKEPFDWSSPVVYAVGVPLLVILLVGLLLAKRRAPSGDGKS
jgi:hypothetical protein